MVCKSVGFDQERGLSSFLKIAKKSNLYLGPEYEGAANTIEVLVVLFDAFLLVA